MVGVAGWRNDNDGMLEVELGVELELYGMRMLLASTDGPVSASAKVSVAG